MSAIATSSLLPEPAPRRLKLTAPVVSEDDIGATVAHAFAVLLPADAVFTGWDLSNARSAAEGARKKRLGCLAGWPDCSVWWRGRVVLLELKRQRGGVISDVQRLVHQRLADAGFPVVVVRSVVEALDAVSAAGVPLRGRVAA